MFEDGICRLTYVGRDAAPRDDNDHLAGLRGGQVIGYDTWDSIVTGNHQPLPGPYPDPA